MNTLNRSNETELIAAASALQEMLGRRRQEIDDARQLPQDLANQLAGLGFYRLVVPEDLGGLVSCRSSFAGTITQDAIEIKAVQYWSRSNHGDCFSVVWFSL